eukprot:scaffold157684_cov28-Tisochrysis_lutea.AAC.2
MRQRHEDALAGHIANTTLGMYMGALSATPRPRCAIFSTTKVFLINQNPAAGRLFTLGPPPSSPSAAPHLQIAAVVCQHKRVRLQRLDTTHHAGTDLPTRES